MNVFFYLPKWVVLKLIRVYQKTLSFDHGPLSVIFPRGFCRFHPTCSEYGYQAIQKHGLLRGTKLTLWRVLRCNPFSNGGIDEIPK